MIHNLKSQFVSKGRYKTFSVFDPKDVSETAGQEVYELALIRTPNGEELRLINRGPCFQTPDIPRYGNHTARLDIIENTFYNTEGSMGVMLIGLKGSGKSLFSEDLCNRVMAKRGIPTLMIADTIPGSYIRQAIQAVGPCIVYFDEFGKTYFKNEMRESLLPLFSDTDIKSVLFIVTGNGYHEFNDALIDRPGRFRYRLFFQGLTVDEVIEVAQRNQIPEWAICALVRYANSASLSYDVLTTVCSLIKGCKDESEIRERLSIYNVPYWTQSAVNILQVKEGPTRLRFDEAEYDGQILKITTVSGTEDQITERIISIPLTETLDWYRTEQQVVKSGDLEVTFRVWNPPQKNYLTNKAPGPLTNEERAFVGFGNRSSKQSNKKAWIDGDIPSFSTGAPDLDQEIMNHMAARQGF